MASHRKTRRAGNSAKGLKTPMKWAILKFPENYVNTEHHRKGAGTALKETGPFLRNFSFAYFSFISA